MEPPIIGESKAIREDYFTRTFFFRQEYQPGAERWVAWTHSLSDLQKLFYRVLDWFPDEVAVLLKLIAENTPIHEDGPWRRYYANCSLVDVAEAVFEQEDLVFLDGGSQLCVMCAPGGDYLALDEHGIFFLYSEVEEFVLLCEEFGLKNRSEQLLYEEHHWHFRPGQYEEGWQRFVQRLGLQQV